MCGIEQFGNVLASCIEQNGSPARVELEVRSDVIDASVEDHPRIMRLGVLSELGGFHLPLEATLPVGDLASRAKPTPIGQRVAGLQGLFLSSPNHSSCGLFRHGVPLLYWVGMENVKRIRHDFFFTKALHEQVLYNTSLLSLLFFGTSSGWFREGQDCPSHSPIGLADSQEFVRWGMLRDFLPKSLLDTDPAFTFWGLPPPLVQVSVSFVRFIIS